MDKLKLAHDWAMKIIEGNIRAADASDLVERAWQYADAMQAEADKRISKERPDVLLTKDKDGNFLHFHREFGRKKCMDCGASLEEWQPDWSQAPDWANWWAMDMDKNCYWYEDKLHLGDVEWDRHSIGKSFKSKPYNYQGNWKDSLRKRPQ